MSSVFQQIFMECDASLSTSITYSTLSLGDEVPISRIVQYVQEQLPIWSVKHMLELWKCLSNVSTNDRVNLRQFKEATKCWIAKVLRTQTQDDNNNFERELYKNTNDATMDSMKTDIDKDITGVELRMRVRKFDEENILLREELARAEELITNLERQCNNLENQLDRYTKKCQQLEKENDEQKDKLDEMIKNEKSYISAYQRSMKQYDSLSKQLETAEIEMQAIQPLKEEMEKISKEKKDCIKQVARLQEEFCEKEEECEKLKVMMTELQDTISNMKETYEYTIRNLRDKNHQLMDENMELQSWSAVQGERSLSPIPDADGCHLHSTPYKLEKIMLENSLYAELRASGFTAECSSKNSCRQELEDELDYYDTVISTILEQLEKVLKTLVTTTDSIDAPQPDLLHTENTRVYNIETLKHKVALLLNTVTEKIARSRNTKDSSTQLCADCSDAIGTSQQFGITSFRAQLTRACQCPKPETDLRLTASQDVSDNKDDPFLKVIQASTSVLDHNIFEVIDPLVEELDRIIEETINSPVVYKDLPASGNPRFRSMYTLPSHPRASSSSPEDIRRAPGQSSRKNSFDANLASGDGLTWTESSGEKSAEFGAGSTCDASGRESPTHTAASRPSEMPKVSSALRMDSKALLTLAETSAKNFQAPEMTVTSPRTSSLTSPRRKLSVYHRSFDVVEVRDTREDDQGPCLEVRRSLSASSVRDNAKNELSGNETTDDCDQNDASTYFFSQPYRNIKHDSDSSNNCSPQKHFWDGDPTDDEPSPIVQPIPRKVYLAPTRLKLLLQEVENSGETSNTSDAKKKKKENTRDCASSATNSPESDVPSSCSTVVGDSPVHLSSTSLITDKYETVVDAPALESNSRPLSETLSQGHLTSARSIPHNRIDSTEIANPESPHSRTSVRRVNDDQPRVERSVDGQMSSRENTSAGKDSECETAKPGDRCVDEGRTTMGANKADQTDDDVAVLPLIGDSPTKKEIPCEYVMQNDAMARDRNLLDAKQERWQQRRFTMRRSFSEGDSDGRALCRCRQHGRSQPLIEADDRLRSFPSLTSTRLQESGIVNLPDMEIISRENLSEFELQKRYTAFSLCLCTDRVTLPRRMELSLRQRDQSEKNLACEVQKMQQDIQELAPLCTDRESVEKVERIRHQLDMVARCAHRVSCAAETLGAVHQEHRVSKAVFVADRYLQLLQSRCEKLAANVAETKRILMENNIMVEENSGELGDDLPRIRYRSGTPANNRMMMARRRASVATMSRPMGSAQDVIKDTVRQRNSVSGRVTLRRTSLNYESSKWENERLGRTDSCSSISELRGIFEHAESRRSSREENNNMLRLNQSSSQSIIIDDEIWTNPKQETYPELLPSVVEDVSQDCEPCAKSSQSSRMRGMVISWRIMLWGILIFFLGFYVNRVLSTVDTCNISYPPDQWLVERIFKRYLRTRNVTPHPT
ncbi:uncharacterized protein LOC105189740 isoform X4 [Harpegnathos saltator]|uniref:uncharacterized protein LOC105189740 isoform X4 n=1 Tax=Harpegnathos saltator TaxID=610380 RepID=UPI00094897F4|nr:uncharacterized protein LOC105189740 isoform X4 [Harpegnathos saltator]